MTFEEKQIYILNKLKEQEAIIYSSPKYTIQNFAEVFAHEKEISFNHLIAILELLEKRNFIKTENRNKQGNIFLTAEGLEWLDKQDKIKSNREVEFVLKFAGIPAGIYYILQIIKFFVHLCTCH